MKTFSLHRVCQSRGATYTRRCYTRRSLLALIAVVPFFTASAVAQTTVTNTTYPSGQTTAVTAPNNIDTSGTVNVSSGANVTFQTTRSIRLAPGVTITNGSNFHAFLTGITSPGAAAAVNGVAFNYQISGGNGQGLYTATGLPAGLSLNSSTGLISGTATVNGTYYVAITFTDANGTYSTTILLSVSANISTTASDGDGVPDLYDPHPTVTGKTDATAAAAVSLNTTTPLQLP